MNGLMIIVFCDWKSRFYCSVNNGKSFSSWSSKLALRHHTNTTVSDCYDVPFVNYCTVRFTPDVTVDSSVPRIHNISPTVQEDIHLFFSKYATGFCVVFGQQWFVPLSLQLPHGCHLAQCVSQDERKESVDCSSLNVHGQRWRNVPVTIPSFCLTSLL